jgi:hypothetical protein
MRDLLDNLPADSIGMNDDELSFLRTFDPGWREIMDAARSPPYRWSVRRLWWDLVMP